MGGRGSNGGGDKMVTVYHRTSPDAAKSIVEQQEFRPGVGGYAYFSSRKNIGPQGRYYGSAVVAVKIPKSEFNLSIQATSLQGVRTITVTPARLKYLMSENSSITFTRVQ